MGGHIDLYLDIASLYSYITFVQVLKTKDILKQHSVEIEIHPFLLGGVNAGSGNKPPWTLPAKAAYLGYESQRSLRAAGLTNVSAPGDLMQAGRTQVPLRALLYIKSRHPEATYLGAWQALLHAFWTLHQPPITAEALRSALSDAAAAAAAAGGVGSPGSPGAGERGRLFAASEVDEIVRAAESPEYKERLKRTTEAALKRGAFGAPWFWVTNAATGQSEPFFGSDRWHHVYEFLGLPYRNVELLPPGAGKSSGAKL